MHMKKLYKFILIIISILILGGIISGLYLFNLKPKDLKKVKPDYIINAADLFTAFENDETIAALKYVDKVIEVTGTIKEIKQGENNSINISLDTGSALSSVICSFQGHSDLPEYNVGDTITVRGECSGFLLDVLLNNCVVITM